MGDGFGVVWSGSVSLLIEFDAMVGSSLARKAHPGTRDVPALLVLEMETYAVRVGRKDLGLGQNLAY